MKRLILPFVAAILVGVGAASTATFMRTKPAPVVADTSKHAAADSTPARVIDSADVVRAPAMAAAQAPDAAVHDDSTSAHLAVPANTAQPIVTAGGTHATQTAGAAATGVPSVKLPASSSAPGADAALAVAPASRRISKVVAAMAPRDAAKVLTQLADHDIAVILGNLTEKQEAAILSQLPADRISAVSKLALRPQPGTE